MADGAMTMKALAADVDAQERAALGRLTGMLSAEIRAGRLMTGRMLERMAEEAFGARASTGRWSWRAAYDALEAGAAHAVLMDADAPTLDALIAAEALRPTQTKRSEEQMRLQLLNTAINSINQSHARIEGFL